MPKYETVFIVRPDVDETVLAETISKVEDLIRTNGGQIVDSQRMGKKRLAYEVKDFTEGFYVQLNFDSPSDFVTKLRGHYQLSDEIIRDMTLREETAPKEAKGD